MAQIDMETTVNGLMAGLRPVVSGRAEHAVRLALRVAFIDGSRSHVEDQIDALERRVQPTTGSLE